MSETILIPRGSVREMVVQRIARFLTALPVEHGWVVEVKRHQKRRSDEQNRLLFGIYYPPIAKHTGYEVGGDGHGNGIHEWMCGTYFGWVDKKVPKTPANPKGIESAPFRTTTRGETGKRNVMTPGDFSDFLDHVERMAAKAGVYIARPDMEQAA